MPEIKINKMGYSRVFSLGNYENEKISVECDAPEGMDTTEIYIELKKCVEDAFNLRHELRNYTQSKAIVKSPDMYRGSEVKAAKANIEHFENKYPNLLDVKLNALLSESGEPISSDEAF